MVLEIADTKIVFISEQIESTSCLTLKFFSSNTFVECTKFTFKNTFKKIFFVEKSLRKKKWIIVILKQISMSLLIFTQLKTL